MTLARAQQLLKAGSYDAARSALNAAEHGTFDPRRTVIRARIEEAAGDLPTALDELERLRA